MMAVNHTRWDRYGVELSFDTRFKGAETISSRFNVNEIVCSKQLERQWRRNVKQLR